MKPELYQEVYLTRDVSETNLKEGDIAMLVDYVSNVKGGEEGAILEIFDVLGESIDVVIVPVSAIATLKANDRPAVRVLAQAA